MIRTFFTNGLKALCFVAFYLLFAASVFAAPAKYTAFTTRVTGKGQPMLLIPGAPAVAMNGTRLLHGILRNTSAMSLRWPDMPVLHRCLPGHTWKRLKSK